MHSAASDTAVVTASIAPAATIIVALLAALAAYLSQKRQHRRDLYSEAVRAVVAWNEMLYRVRRRGDDEDRDLVSRFHDLQDVIAYHRAWVGSDSKYMMRSYDRFAKGVKTKIAPLITAAWGEPPREAGASLADEERPDLSDLTDSFLADVRSHLSSQPWRRMAMAWRNTKKE